MSDVLADCRADRAVTARFGLRGPFALASLGVEGALIRMSTGGGYWIQVADDAPRWIGPGDLVLLPLGTAHSVSSDPALPLQPIASLIARHAVGEHGDAPLVFDTGEGDTRIELFSAHLWLSAYGRDTVMRLLPPIIHVADAASPSVGPLAAMMQALVDETLAQQPGWKLSAARMADLLLVHVLRAHLAQSGMQHAGWLRGLTDPSIARVLMAIHRAPDRSWTLDALAREAGMSRTRFAARFRERVDVSPIQYLATHRLTLAADRLAQGGQRVSEVARQLGFTSDKVFARAFTRWAGVTPGAYGNGQRKALASAAAGTAAAGVAAAGTAAAGIAAAGSAAVGTAAADTATPTAALSAAATPAAKISS
ncbi:AraC family transcriptional regulator [Pigmentiphaga litoralis]|uniref:AraC-like DNA-binding protein n=1 Tax=Pigmentiphaga litoralis TaxID=516702 RepID=A0A7Y9LNL1_9BURK|nr:AraC family transcriptional regulator [Pigmentiphaga litoralis]NYE23092.1 AraC-like DNA-binding protein [Pigmentiphaga litoralis]NYE83293.1 AraC-like DNA-binding protein [Pigmentiphaga litoralis]